MSFRTENKIEVLIKELINKIERYIKGDIRDSELIAKELSRLIANKSIGEFFVNNRSLGITFFNDLRKYFPIRIERIDASLHELLTQAGVPLSVIKWALQAVLEEKIKLTLIVELPAITISRIERGIKRLKSKRKLNMAKKYDHESVYKSELKVLMQKTLLLKDIAQEPETKYIILALQKEGVNKNHNLFRMTSREFKLRLLAALKYGFSYGEG